MENCTVSKFYQQLHTDNPYYIVGATTIFERNPELHDMVSFLVIHHVQHVPYT